jgi:hypothetical protein
LAAGLAERVGAAAVARAEGIGAAAELVAELEAAAAPELPAAGEAEGSAGEQLHAMTLTSQQALIPRVAGHRIRVRAKGPSSPALDRRCKTPRALEKALAPRFETWEARWE